jgi:hypothetical protein
MFKQYGICIVMTEKCFVVILLVLVIFITCSTMWKRLQRLGKEAYKFQFTASYQDLNVQFANDKKLVILPISLLCSSNEISFDPFGSHHLVPSGVCIAYIFFCVAIFK